MILSPRDHEAIGRMVVDLWRAEADVQLLTKNKLPKHPEWRKAYNEARIRRKELRARYAVSMSSAMLAHVGGLQLAVVEREEPARPILRVVR